MKSVGYHISALSNEVLKQLAIDCPLFPEHQASRPVWTCIPVIDIGFEDKFISKLLPKVEIHGIITSFAENKCKTFDTLEYIWNIF